MRPKMPVVAVLGRKKSGKTTVVESVVRGLTKKGYRVATAKHVNQEGFSIDTKGKDTWRHSTAGANPVVSVSDVETAILIRNGKADFSIDRLLRCTPEVDVFLLEGFSDMVLDDEHVGKILCVRNEREYDAYREKARGETIAYCSHTPMGDRILGIKEDSPVLIRRVLKFIKKELRILKILSDLPGLDCKKCGYDACQEMAIAIYRKKAKLSDCQTLKLRRKLQTKIELNDVEIPIQPFVAKIFRNAVLGMVSSLKGVSIRGDEKIYVKVSSPK